MAYSKLTLDWLTVPPQNSVLNIYEVTTGLNLNEIFKSTRMASFQTTIPLFVRGNEMRPDEYKGFISRYYKTAFDIDYNSGGLFTVTAIDGPDLTGLGTVIIEANFSNAQFQIVSSTSDIWILIENENETEEPEIPSENSVEPKTLFFKADVSALDIPIQEVEIVTEHSWNIISELPEWLEILQLSGTGNSTSFLKIVNYEFIDPGIYNTQLVYKIEEETFSVLITLELLKTLYNPYDPNKPAFTLDQKNFRIQSENSDTYFQFNSSISVYSFFSDEVQTKFVPQKALLFNGKMDINIGKLIHRLMDNFSTINDSITQYKFASLDIECIEIKQSDDSIIGRSNLSNIKFVAGFSKGFENYGFLEFNRKPSRVTKDGYYLLNILIPNGSYEIRTFKNSTLVNTEILPPNSYGPLCKKVTFENYEKGDQIEFQIDVLGENNVNAPSKKINIFPSQYFSNVIVWENEFLLQSALEFTHDHDIKSDIERQSSKSYNGFTEKTIVHSTSKENRLTINTGWVSKSDIDTIESLLLSKRAFLEIDGKIIQMVPNGKTLTNYDSNQELFDFTIEFTINRIYNEETYTF